MRHENKAMLTVPGDVPLVEEEDIRQLIDAHRDTLGRDARAFIIVPARDERGSNAILCSPARAVQRMAFEPDRKSTRLNSSHQIISYAVFCLKKKKIPTTLKLSPYSDQT